MGLRIDDKLVVYANLSNLSVLPQDPIKERKGSCALFQVNAAKSACVANEIPKRRAARIKCTESALQIRFRGAPECSRYPCKSLFAVIYLFDQQLGFRACENKPVTATRCSSVLLMRHIPEISEMVVCPMDWVGVYRLFGITQRVEVVWTFCIEVPG